MQRLDAEKRVMISERLGAIATAVLAISATPVLRTCR